MHIWDEIAHKLIGVCFYHGWMRNMLICNKSYVSPPPKGTKAPPFHANVMVHFISPWPTKPSSLSFNSSSVWHDILNDQAGNLGRWLAVEWLPYNGSLRAKACFSTFWFYDKLETLITCSGQLCLHKFTIV